MSLLGVKCECGETYQIYCNNNCPYHKNKKMTRLEFQQFLDQYPPDMQMKIFVNHSNTNSVQKLDSDHVIITSDTAYIDTDAPEEQWDTEDGKVELGDGEKYLLINPMIL